MVDPNGRWWCRRTSFLSSIVVEPPERLPGKERGKSGSSPSGGRLVVASGLPSRPGRGCLEGNVAALLSCIWLEERQ